jgi:hypothetical protein
VSRLGDVCRATALGCVGDVSGELEGFVNSATLCVMGRSVRGVRAAATGCGVCATSGCAVSGCSLRCTWVTAVGAATGGSGVRSVTWGAAVSRGSAGVVRGCVASGSVCRGAAGVGACATSVRGTTDGVSTVRGRVGAVSASVLGCVSVSLRATRAASARVAVVGASAVGRCGVSAGVA